jgi:AAA+ ATPase superfamily predicted ATPase
MEFYNREPELETLHTLLQHADKQAQMVVLTGRRRTGKTLLVQHFAKMHPKCPCLYFFVSKKAESLLCEEYLEEIKGTFDMPIFGDIQTFNKLFELLLSIAQKQKFILIIDEFQEFFNINPTIYSDMQKLWDLNKQSCHLQLILVGSVYSLMYKIFENNKEPLFGRADRLLRLKSFSIKTLSSILNDHQILSSKALFDYYIFTGGTPKYVDLFISNQAYDYDNMLKFILSLNSPFLHEGKHVLIEEFGKDYHTYFSILQLIATGYTGRGELESILQKNIGGYIARLLTDYAVIAKHNPIDAKENSKLQKYKLIDNFLNFWFRFIYKNFSTIENENFDYVRKIIDRDFSTYSGMMLEKFYHELFWASKKYNKIGSYWEKGNKNEIDLVAINDMDKTCVIADIKLNKTKLNLPLLKQKSKGLIAEYSGYDIQWIGLSLSDLSTEINP